MSLINTTKWGNCCQCSATNTAVVKVAKSLYCLHCHKTNKTKVQIEKAKDRAKIQRSLSQLKVSPENMELVRKQQSKNTERGDWYLERRKEMSGVCVECGKTTSKGSDKYFTWSICHIVPKSLVPSVATHEHNWIELCQQHHQQFDSTFDNAEKMMCFGEVKQKFQLFKHLIPNEQLRKVNPHLLK